MSGTKEYEWRHLNQRRNYPFVDGSTLRVDAIFLPKSWAVDASIVVGSEDSARSECYISAITREGGAITLTLKVGLQVVGEAIFDVKSPSSHIKFYSTISKRYMGSLIVDPALNIFFLSFKEGTTIVPPSAITFCPSVIRLIPSPSVTSIRPLNGDKGVSGGEVYLVGGDGVTLDVGDDPNSIKINILGDPNFYLLNCEDTLVSEAPMYLKAIKPAYVSSSGVISQYTKVEADSWGNFVFMASDAFSGSDEDGPYDVDQPSLSVYRDTGQVMFEVLGLNKLVD